MANIDVADTDLTKGHPLVVLFRMIRDERMRVVWATVCSVVNKIFDVMPEILIGIALDVVVRGEDSFVAQAGLTDPTDQLIALGIATFLIWFGESVFEYLYQILWRGLAQDVQHRLRVKCYDHAQYLPTRYYEEQRSGNLVAILNDDINQLERFLDGGANVMIQTFAAVVLVGAVFFIISPLIAAIAFLPVPAIIFGAFWFQKRAQTRCAPAPASSAPSSPPTFRVSPPFAHSGPRRASPRPFPARVPPISARTGRRSASRRPSSRSSAWRSFRASSPPS
jgi:ABC-type multidrug transport system fused ATPase/permease subunit